MVNSSRIVQFTSIFIATITNSESPFFTESPGFTRTFSTTPGIGLTAALLPELPIPFENESANFGRGIAKRHFRAFLNNVKKKMLTNGINVM